MNLQLRNGGYTKILLNEFSSIRHGSTINSLSLKGSEAFSLSAIAFSGPRRARLVGAKGGTLVHLEHCTPVCHVETIGKRCWIAIVARRSATMACIGTAGGLSKQAIVEFPGNLYVYARVSATKRERKVPSTYCEAFAAQGRSRADFQNILNKHAQVLATFCHRVAIPKRCRVP